MTKTKLKLGLNKMNVNKMHMYHTYTESVQ